MILFIIIIIIIIIKGPIVFFKLPSHVALMMLGGRVGAHAAHIAMLIHNNTDKCWKKWHVTSLSSRPEEDLVFEQ